MKSLILTVFSILGNNTECGKKKKVIIGAAQNKPFIVVAAEKLER